MMCFVTKATPINIINGKYHIEKQVIKQVKVAPNSSCMASCKVYCITTNL